MNTAHAENRFHRPLTEVTEEELLRAIAKGWQDAPQARAELVRRGWTEKQIAGYFGETPAPSRTSTLDDFLIISTAHGLHCDGCYRHAESSVTMAKVTGSVGSSGSEEARDPDTGELVQGHAASVLRADVDVLLEALRVATARGDAARYTAVEAALRGLVRPTR